VADLCWSVSLCLVPAWVICRSRPSSRASRSTASSGITRSRYRRVCRSCEPTSWHRCDRASRRSERRACPTSESTTKVSTRHHLRRRARLSPAGLTTPRIPLSCSGLLSIQHIIDSPNKALSSNWVEYFASSVESDRLQQEMEAEERQEDGDVQMQVHSQEHSHYSQHSQR
jgi:hypothetical protein